jgi:hypothetical protein
MENQSERLDELELLRLQNINLRLDALVQAHTALAKDRDAMVRELQAKYGKPGENFQIGSDGTILRPPSPLQSVPESA